MRALDLERYGLRWSHAEHVLAHPLPGGARRCSRATWCPRPRGPGLLRFARFALLPVRRLIEDEFTGPGALLLAGSALHADLMPESAGSSLYGWLLQCGWPVPELHGSPGCSRRPRLNAVRTASTTVR